MRLGPADCHRHYACLWHPARNHIRPKRLVDMDSHNHWSSFFRVYRVAPLSAFPLAQLVQDTVAPQMRPHQMAHSHRSALIALRANRLGRLDRLARALGGRSHSRQNRLSLDDIRNRSYHQAPENIHKHNFCRRKSPAETLASYLYNATARSFRPSPPGRPGYALVSCVSNSSAVRAVSSTLLIVLR